MTLVPGQKTTLVTAKNQEGSGTWIYRFGDEKSAGESIILEVPKSATSDSITYETSLTWELSAVPENDWTICRHERFFLYSNGWG